MTNKRQLTKHTFKLFAGQVEAMATLHPNIPVSVAIRRLLDAYIAKRRSMEPKAEINFEEVDVEL